MLQVHYSSFLSGLPVWSLQAGEPVARLGTPVIDPDTLQVKGFHVKYENKNMILSSADVREIAREGVVIDREDLFSDLEDLPKLQPLAELNWSPIGLKVITKTQRFLGHITDYTIAGDSLHIYQLLVEPPAKPFARKDRTFLINRSQILEYDDRRFIVRDVGILSLTEKIDFSQFYNPFRRSLLDNATKELP
jgi:sporulation protein YlmC with PRC-barrel domain